jgi:hypothetical protein
MHMISYANDYLYLQWLYPYLQAVQVTVTAPEMRPVLTVYAATHATAARMPIALFRITVPSVLVKLALKATQTLHVIQVRCVCVCARVRACVKYLLS